MDIFEKIKCFISKFNYDFDITPDTLLKDIFGNNLKYIEFVMSISSEFNIDIAYDEVKNCKTVNDFVNYVSIKICP